MIAATGILTRRRNPDWNIFLLFLFVSPSVKAQRPHTGGWFSAQFPVSISAKWQWSNDVGYRTLGMSTAASQFLYRTGIRYSKNERLTVAAGGAFFSTRTSYDKRNHEFGSELRLWQEINCQVNLKQVNWLNRFRTEQRFFTETMQRKAYSAMRFRIKTSFLKNISDKWSIQLADEYMQQIAHHKCLFDQNRIILSGIFKCSGSLQVQSGYMLLSWPSFQQHIILAGIQKTLLLHGKNS